MSEFKVYKHPVNGYEAVKIGFSWPGLFFTWIWAFVKRLWVPGIILIPVIFVCNSIAFFLLDAKVSDPDGGNALFYIILIVATFGPGIFVGMKGNNWRESSMVTRGYTYIDTIEAGAPEGAIAKASSAENKNE